MISDLRQAVRSLGRAPGFTTVAVLTLALGIGAVATVLSWVEGLVLNPAPAVREPGRLVELELRPPWAAGQGLISYPDYQDVRAEVRSLDGVAAYAFQELGLREGAAGPAEPVSGMFVSDNYFRVLGVAPHRGRFFLPADSVAPNPAPSAVVSHALWRQRWGGDPRVVGRRLRINGEVMTVVGVAPPGFRGNTSALGADLWVPLTAYDRLGPEPGKLDRRGDWWLGSVARVRPGATVEEAAAEVGAFGRAVTARQREHPDVGLGAVPFRGGPAQQVIRPLMAVLLGAAAVVMLLVCANVANLLLVRTSVRGRELAVRAALGAGRGRLARQLLAECVVLAAAAALVGVTLAGWTGGALQRLLPESELPLAVLAPLDGRVLAGTAAVALAAVLLFGVAPALGASRVDVATALRRGAQGGGRHRSRLRDGLVVSQVALSLVALGSAGLFLRSLGTLRNADPGFRDPGQVLLVGTHFGFAGVRDRDAQREGVDRLLERVRAIPGVREASAATFVQLSVRGADAAGVRVPDAVAGSGGVDGVAQASQVSPGYFAAMGMPIVRGRALDERDRAGSPPVVVVNEAFARRFWGDGDPIGRRVSMWGEATVVGVARDGVYDFDGVGKPTPPFVYLPYAQHPADAVTLHLRADGPPAALVPAVRRAMAEVDRALPVLRPRTLAEHASGAFFIQRIAATVLGVLGGAAALLAALGVYGVIAYSVSRRAREIGIRAALGAAERRIAAGFVGHSLRLAALGLALGTLGTLALGRLLGSRIPGVAAADPPTLLAAALGITALALAASWIPARRAAHVDPAVALRAE
jgi:predicted permease